MKTKYIFLILCFLGIAMGSCKDDSAKAGLLAESSLQLPMATSEPPLH